MHQIWPYPYRRRSEVTPLAVHSLSVVHGDLSGVCSVTFTHGRVTLLTRHSSVKRPHSRQRGCLYRRFWAINIVDRTRGIDVRHVVSRTGHHTVDGARATRPQNARKRARRSTTRVANDTQRRVLVWRPHVTGL